MSWLVVYLIIGAFVTGLYLGLQFSADYDWKFYRLVFSVLTWPGVLGQMIGKLVVSKWGRP